MGSRAEITVKYAKVYAKASKRDRGRILDEVVPVTGRSRDNARRSLVAARKTRPPGKGKAVEPRPRKPRARKFSYGALRVLQRAWAASGGSAGKYLAASMGIQLDGLERHGELAVGVDGYDDRRDSRTSLAKRFAYLRCEISAIRDAGKAREASWWREWICRATRSRHRPAGRYLQRLGRSTGARLGLGQGAQVELDHLWIVG